MKQALRGFQPGNSSESSRGSLWCNNLQTVSDSETRFDVWLCPLPSFLWLHKSHSGFQQTVFEEFDQSLKRAETVRAGFSFITFINAKHPVWILFVTTPQKHSKFKTQLSAFSYFTHKPEIKMLDVSNYEVTASQSNPRMSHKIGSISEITDPWMFLQEYQNWNQSEQTCSLISKGTYQNVAIINTILISLTMADLCPD